ncbi:MAG TPA: adenylosuccinate lyase [Candidatus Saccharibacteria bacterium]|nr:adenylosuccinate lyase [Candidatus Saccharibacteria bacterium]
MQTLKPIVLPKVPAHFNATAIDPLDGRYYDPEIATYLSEQSRVAYQAYVEMALAYTLADFGICSKESAKAIEKAARAVDIVSVYKEEQTTKHDIKALVNCIKVPLNEEAKPFVHFGATSYDIIATANALQMRDAIQKMIVPKLQKLLATLIQIASDNKETVQIGRTHGQHAVPITFGFAIAEYVSRLGTSIQNINALAGELRGKFSGAVGAYNALSVFVADPIAFEKAVLDKVDLQPAPYATQIVPPESMVRLVDELAIAAGIMANLAHDMRHLQRTEIAEVQEAFEKGQTGSSTMAHKRNPWNFENVVSMSKQVLAQVVNANQNLSSEHQRDLTDSASSRFYAIPVACVASMANRLDRIMRKLEVNAEQMQKNLLLTGGAIAAEPLYLLLEKYGHTEAHEAAKQIAHQALANKQTLAVAAANDESIQQYWARFNEAEKELIASPEVAYIGKAIEKTQTIVDEWQSYLQALSSRA